ncbi:MAG: gliding motility-associated ABC transporter ATP-binding subunit GldA [bacterium]|jgi:ABC-2 type transport system ATP-binding protein
MATIELEGITKLYGQQKALDNVSLKIDRGEVVGLLGPNGAGKSTMMKILTSFLPPTSGRAAINGLDVETSSLEIRRLVGYLPENNPLYLDMYVREYLAFVLGIYGNPPKREKIVEDIIDLTGLTAEANKKIGALSKGYRQRVGLAQALIHDPEILILDEPTSGLDPNQLIGIRKIIKEMGETKTVILSTHIMQEVEAVCGRVVIIDKGKIIADDSTANLSKMAGSARYFKIEFKENISAEILRKLPFINKVEKTGEKEWLVESLDNRDIRQDLFSFAVKNKLNILSLSQTAQNMEHVFRKLTRS